MTYPYPHYIVTITLAPKFRARTGKPKADETGEVVGDAVIARACYQDTIRKGFLAEVYAVDAGDLPRRKLTRPVEELSAIIQAELRTPAS